MGASYQKEGHTTKKILSLLMVLALCLPLCACGGSDAPEANEPVMTKEEMLAIATSHYSVPFSDELSENIVKANATYLDQTVSIMGVMIAEIKMDHAVVKQGYTQFNLYLPMEELAELSQGDHIRVVGKISKFDTVTETYEGLTWDLVSVDMSPAYVVDKYFEMEDGLFSYMRTDDSGRTYCFLFGDKLVDSYGNYIVYFSDEDLQRIDDLSKQQMGMSIDLHGNLIGITWEDKYGQCMLIEDAVIDNLE